MRDLVIAVIVENSCGVDWPAMAEFSLSEGNELDMSLDLLITH